MQMTPIDPSSHLTDRFRGCLLGHALGDSPGAPFEGLSNETLYRSDGSAGKVFTAPPVERLMSFDRRAIRPTQQFAAKITPPDRL